MKRLLPLIFLICLVSCSGREFINPALPCDLSVTCPGTGAEFSAKITDTECILKLTSGEMAGTETVFTVDGRCTASAGGFTCEASPNSFPAQYAFCRAMRAVTGTEGQKTDDGNTLKYSLDEMEILVYYGQESRRLERIETDERGRRFIFSVNADV